MCRQSNKPLPFQAFQFFPILSTMPILSATAIRKITFWGNFAEEQGFSLWVRVGEHPDLWDSNTDDYAVKITDGNIESDNCVVVLLKTKDSFLEAVELLKPTLGDPSEINLEEPLDEWAVWEF